MVKLVLHLLTNETVNCVLSNSSHHVVFPMEIHQIMV